MPWLPWFLIVIAMIAIIAGMISGQSHPSADMEKERIVFRYLALIDSAQNADELTGMLIEVFQENHQFYPELQIPFLLKARSFGNELTSAHWRLICGIAESGSELEREALRQIGSRVG